MRNYIAKNVDEYIAGSAPEARPHLEELREIIKSTVSEAEESISWGVPFYKYKGLLGGFSAFKNHVSFGLGGPVLQSGDREMLGKEGYVTGKKIIQIRFDQKVPVATIKRILRSQAKMNEVKRGI